MTKPDRNCLFCSAQTIEQRNVDKGKPIVHHPTCEEGLQCFSCNSRACTNCLQDILEAHSEKLISRDRWCQQVQSFLLSGTAPKGFIGHCCELKVASTQFRKQQKQQPPLNKTLFDGHLHFPEFGILVDSPFSCKDSCIDVLGLGEAKPLPPTWHCVISHDSAATYHDKNIKPNGKGAIVDDGIVQEVCVPLPYKDNECRKVCKSISCSSLKFRCYSQNINPCCSLQCVFELLHRLQSSMKALQERMIPVLKKSRDVLLLTLMIDLKDLMSTSSLEGSEAVSWMNPFFYVASTTSLMV